jgi:hypothetical protein
VYLRGNVLLEGKIPSELGSLSPLEYLSVLATKIAGQITSELGNLESLKMLLLDLTRLIGEMSNEVCALHAGNLTRLSSDCFREVECSYCSICF